MPVKVLMVCLGNICRSPIAHGLLQHKVNERNLNWEIDSAGTSRYHTGALPDPRSVACMKHHGIDITYQRSRPITNSDLDYFDLIYVMDKENLADVLQMAVTPVQRNKVSLIMSLVSGQKPAEVPDPYYDQTQNGFEYVYNMLDNATNKLLEKYTGR